MNILCIGDIVGRSGRNSIEALLEEIKKEHNIDFVICNAENSAGGFGATPRTANRLFELGCDVLTMGDHVWDRQELMPYLDKRPNIIRPANLPSDTPGRGWCVAESPSGVKIGVINLLGRVFMRYNVACPFRSLDEIVETIKKETHIIVVDFHAEATSEKVALGFYMDGKVSVLFGTHTHIQTADEKILDQGTAYITDLGMSGPYDSVIGQKKEIIIKRFLTTLPERFELADSVATLHGIVVEVDDNTGKAVKIERIQRCASET